MTGCCRSAPAEQIFRPGTARNDLKRYRAKGLDELERRMVASVPPAELPGARVLEIGGGIGAIQVELLAAGAVRGEIVELVSSYEPYAFELARERGVEERHSYRVADLLDEPDAVEPADVVVLNRVVCCSPDGIELAATAARLARRALLLSYPRDAARARIGIGVLNFGQWALRRSFRAFVHSPGALRAAAEAHGLRVTETGRSAFWEFTTLRRAT
jgi:magnesium-protoporphyrin O-methyltransferase